MCFCWPLRDGSLVFSLVGSPSAVRSQDCAEVRWWRLPVGAFGGGAVREGWPRRPVAFAHRSAAAGRWCATSWCAQLRSLVHVGLFATDLCTFPWSGSPSAGVCGGFVAARRLPVRVSIVVSISACHADDPGSIPGRGILLCPVFRNHSILQVVGV